MECDTYLANEEIKGKRIMVVDDEFDLTLFYKMLLEFHGFNVNTFNDPLKALSVFKANCYDLVILDIKMPEMDGFELYREMQKIDSKVKYCFLTAHQEEFIKEELSELNKGLIIHKPIEDEKLMKEIRHLVGN